MGVSFLAAPENIVLLCEKARCFYLRDKNKGRGGIIVDMSNSGGDNLQAMRHSLAHIMASAIAKLWPKARFGVGPVVENGFYYDIDVPGVAISEEDFPKIETEMRKIISEKQVFEHSVKPIDEALGWAKASRQPYKEELLNDLMRAGTTLASDLNSDELGTITEGEAKASEASFYTNGDFTDLCRGPHAKTTGDVGEFKLMRVAGAYWRGKDTNPQMQRLYGVAFETKKELAEHLLMLEEAKKRDHRKLGLELDLFFMHETAPGMAYWLPKGVVLYNELIRFWREEHAPRGYQEVVSPLINKQELYVTSGHFDHYWGEMFTTDTQDNESYGLKPMNCPNAMIVYKHKPHSYKELPIRYSDTDTLHRFELSGTLHGLLRAREFKQDDAHIFVSEEQIEEEYKNIFEITELFYGIFGLKYSFRLGTRPKKFIGDPKTWDKAESTLKKILEESGKDYFVLEGDGAFYGPKIDILMEDSLGRPWQMGTLQLDFQQPLNFGLVYTDADGTEKMPVVIHRVIYGSIERFIGILIEHTGGKFPVWLAPEQIRIVTPNQDEKVVELAQKIADDGRKHGLRVELDMTNESVGKKIRESEMMKVPYLIVIGAKELESGLVVPRVRSDMRTKEGDVEPLKVDDFLQAVAGEAKSRVSKSSI